jgi:hypothetical protein
MTLQPETALQELRTMATQRKQSWLHINKIRRSGIQDELSKCFLADGPIHSKQLVDIVWCLGKARAEPRFLQPNFISSMWEALAITKLEKRSSSKLMYGLANMRIQWNEIPTNVVTLLLDALAAQTPAMNELELSSVVFSLGKMEVQWETQLPLALRTQIMDELYRTSAYMGEVGVSTVLLGLGKSGAQWGSIPLRLRSALTEQLHQNPRLGPQAYSNCASGLARLGATFDTLPPRMREVLVRGLRHALSLPSPPPASAYMVPTSASEQTLSTVVWALGSLGVDYRLHLDSRGRAALDALLLARVPELTLQGVSNTVYGLARMRWSLRYASSDLRLALERRLQWWAKTAGVDAAVAEGGRARDEAPQGQGSATHTQASSNIMWGLGQFRVRWPSSLSSFPPAALARSEEREEVIDEEDEERSESGSDIESSGAGEGEYTLPPEVAEALLTKATAALPFMSEQGVSNTLSGLANMKALWLLLPPVTRGALQDTLLRCGAEMPGQAVSSSLWALGSMGAQLARSPSSEPDGGASPIELSLPVTSLLLDALARLADAGRLTPQSLALSLYALSLLSEPMGANVSIRAVVSAEPAQEEGGGGAYNMSLPSDAALIAMCRAFPAAVPHMSAREVATVVYALGRLSKGAGGLPSGAFTFALQSTMLRAVERTAADMTAQDVGSVVWGLCGQLGMIFSRLPRRTQQALTNAMTSPSTRLRKKQLSAILLGLSRHSTGSGGTRWRALPAVLQNTLAEALERTVSVSSATATCGNAFRACVFAGNVFYALGCLETQWTSLSNFSFPQNLLGTLPLPPHDESLAEDPRLRNPVRPELCGQPVSFVLNGLSRMGFWDVACDGDRRVLLEALRATVPHMSAACVANSLWSLGRMGVPLRMDQGEAEHKLAAELGATTAALSAALTKAIPRMTGFECAWSLWALARCGIAFEALPSELSQLLVATTTHLVPSMNSRELGVALWALGRMRAPVARLPPALINSLFFGIESLVSSNTNERNYR